MRHSLTADKREIKDFPKLPSATSFILVPLYDIPPAVKRKIKKEKVINYVYEN